MTQEAVQNRAAYFDPQRPGARSAGLPAPSGQNRLDPLEQHGLNPHPLPSPEFSHSLDRLAAREPVSPRNLSDRSVRRIIRVEELPAIRFGGSPRIRNSELRALLENAPPYRPDRPKDE